MKELRDVHLFELLNVNRDSNNFSAGGQPGTEEIWDALLSRGKVFYGVASDDTHDYLGDFIPDRAYPGKGWVMVRVAELTPRSGLRALENGDFYASTRHRLADVTITDHEYRLAIKPLRDTAYTTLFIGRTASVLKEETGLNAGLYLQAATNCMSAPRSFPQAANWPSASRFSSKNNRIIPRFIFAASAQTISSISANRPSMFSSRGNCALRPLQIVPRLPILK